MMNKPYPCYIVPEYKDLPELLDMAKAKYIGKTAFRTRRRSNETQISYDQLNSDVKRLSSYIGRTVGSRQYIAVLGENCYEWLLTYFAVVCSNNIIVPIDRELSADDIAGLLIESNCHSMVYSSTYRDIFDALSDTIPDFEGIEMTKLRGLINTEAESGWIPTNRDDPAALIYTSGTTGKSKGVILSQWNLCSDARAASKFIELYGRTIALLPFHHTFAFTVNVLCSITVGVDTLIPTSLKNTTELIGSFKPTYLTVVPMILEMLDKTIQRKIAERKLNRVFSALNIICKPFDAVGIGLRSCCFNSIRKGLGGEIAFFISGGAPLDTEIVTRFETYGISVLNGYGITECSPVVSVNRRYHHRLGSVGQALPGVEVRIQDANEHGEGEICVKGDIVMLGYHNLPDETEDAIKNGWFHTGDIGRIGEDGFIYITGRIKNLIILSNGKNVSPEELETLIGRVPGVQEVIVRAESNTLIAEVFPDEDFNKTLTDPQAYYDLQIKRLNDRLPVYKYISSVRIRHAAFKKTTTKKIIRLQK